MFSVENFLSRSAEKFREESFSASLFSGIEKFYASERGRGYRDFPSKMFCLTVSKISLGVIL